MLTDLTCMATVCIPAFISSIDGIFTIGTSLLLLGVSFWKIRKKETANKTFWIYAHIFAIVFPVLYFLFSLKCGSFLACMASAYLTAIPVSILGAIILGYIVAPLVYQYSLKATEVVSGDLYEKIKEITRIEGMKMPKIFLIDDISPKAFSSTSIHAKIFFSVGLLELLSRKELESVILHEVYHIKTKTPKIKSLGFFLTKISPIFAFSEMKSLFSQEEKNADNFAIGKQKTEKHLNTAKNKLNKLNSKLSTV